MKDDIHDLCRLYAEALNSCGDWCEQINGKVLSDIVEYSPDVVPDVTIGIKDNRNRADFTLDAIENAEAIINA
jgi:hypothetical protein